MSRSCKPVLHNFDPKNNVLMIMSLQKYFIVAGFVPALNLVPDIGNLWLNVRLCGDV